MNKDYVEIATKKVFAQADKKKLSKKVFEKEMINAARYGNVNALQTIFSKHTENPYQTVDELLGDMEILACEQSRKIKIDLNLKTPFIHVDNIVRN